MNIAITIPHNSNPTVSDTFSPPLSLPVGSNDASNHGTCMATLAVGNYAGAAKQANIVRIQLKPDLSTRDKNIRVSKYFLTAFLLFFLISIYAYTAV